MISILSDPRVNEEFNRCGTKRAGRIAIVLIKAHPPAELNKTVPKRRNLQPPVCQPA